jgi:hypothetical protein
VARKHNCKHNRTPGGYARRLRARGESRTPRMRWTGQPTEKIVSDLRIMRERDAEFRRNRPSRSREWR